MPLQIRRGLDTERTAAGQPFALGELILSYATRDVETGALSEAKLYIGDGVTTGGIPVTGFTTGDAIDAIGAALVEGNSFNNSIEFIYGITQRAAGRIDATVNLAQLENNFDLNGYDIVGTGNISIIGTVEADLKGPLYAADNTLLINTTTKVFTGSVTGDVTGNLTGDVTGNLTGDVTGNLTGNVAGNVTGNVTGDVNGSIFGDDSSMLVDGTSNIIGNASTMFMGSVFDAGDLAFDIKSTGPESLTIRTLLQVGGIGGATIRTSGGTLDEPTDTAGSDLLGGYKFYGYNSGEYKFAAAVVSQWEAGANFSTTYPKSTVALIAGSNDSVFHQATLNGEGVFTSPIFQPASYATGSLPTTTGATEEGYIVFDSTTKQFKGWNGSAWVVLG